MENIETKTTRALFPLLKLHREVSVDRLMVVNPKYYTVKETLNDSKTEKTMQNFTTTYQNNEVIVIADDGTEEGLLLGTGYIEDTEPYGWLLHLDINIGTYNKKSGTGRIVFNMIYDRFEKEFGNGCIMGLVGKWLDQDDMNDNLESFNAAIRRGVPAKEAALYHTFTGKMAQEKVCTKIPPLKGYTRRDGTYEYVEEIIFLKDENIDS